MGSTDRIYVFGPKPYSDAITHLQIADHCNPRSLLIPGKTPTFVFIYFELFWYILVGWFYRLIIVLTFKLFIFKLRTLFSLQYYCAFFSSHQQCVPFPLYGIRTTLLWPVIVLLCLCFLSVSTRTLDIPLLCSLLTVIGATLVVKWINIPLRRCPGNGDIFQ